MSLFSSGGHEHDSSGAGAVAASTSSTAPRSELTLQVPVDAAYVHPFNGDIRSIGRFSIGIELEGRRNCGGLFFAGGVVNLRPDSLPQRAVSGAWMFESGIAYRHYFSHPKTLVSPYLSASVSAMVLEWEYRNEVIVDNDTIHSDGLLSFNGYLGLGVAFLRSKPVSFYGEVGFGGTVFAAETGQGFGNDVFDDYGYFSAKAGLTFRF